MRHRARAVGMLLLVGVFALGALGGMAADEGFGLDWFDFLDEDAMPTDEQLLTGLELTGGQRRRIASILERREARLEAYWETRLPDLQRIMDSSYTEIRSVLTAQQHPAFDQRVGRLRGRMSGDRD